MSPFVRIREYCRDAGLDKYYERFLFHKFEEDLQGLIQEYEKTKGSKPSDEVNEGFINTLINHNTLSTNILLAETEKKVIIEKEINKVKMDVSIKVFGLNVLAGVLASIIFTLLLVVIFSLAQNQIKSWINDIYSDNKLIEQQVNNK